MELGYKKHGGHALVAPAWLFGAAALGVGQGKQRIAIWETAGTSSSKIPSGKKAMNILIMYSIMLSLFIPKF